MSTSLTINGVTFAYPETGDLEWGDEASGWASAVTSGALYKSGGTFTLAAEVDFGSSYGLKSLYYKSRTSDVASAGQIRLAKTDDISFRNNADDGDLDLDIGGDDLLQFGGVDLIDATTAQSMSSKTLTSPVLNTAVSGTAVLDEDDLSTDSDTQIATQQSIKAYADTKLSPLVQETQFVVANDQSDQDVTGMVVNGALYRGAKIEYTVYRTTATKEYAEKGTLELVYKTSAGTWELKQTSVGASGVTFVKPSAAAGQVRYSSDNMSGGTYVGKMRFQIIAISVES